MPYTTWISRLQLIPATIVHTEIDEASVEQLVAGIASLVAGFLDDRQPGSVAIYSYILCQIVYAINDPGLKILFEPKSQ